jgi:hypothetical protein
MHCSLVQDWTLVFTGDSDLDLALTVYGSRLDVKEVFLRPPATSERLSVEEFL